jgi:ATP-dependent RNA helicase DDX27
MSFAEIHGNLPQGDRVRALQQFQQGEATFLLATDLAARGLDLANVETVINFHLPLDISRYIHRVGRTARMGRAGRAVTIYTTSEYAKVKQLGRQCCSKVKSKVLKRTIAADAVRTWADKIQSLAEDITSINEEEGLERELRLADILANRSENLQKHKADIQARPAKQWIMTNIDKRKLKEEDNERVRKVAAGAEEDPAAAGGNTSDVATRKDNKRGREPTLEDVEERRKRRMVEQLKRKKEKEKAERIESERMVRASARRSRKASKPARPAGKASGAGASGNANGETTGRAGKKKKKKGKH